MKLSSSAIQETRISLPAVEWPPLLLHCSREIGVIDDRVRIFVLRGGGKTIVKRNAIKLDWIGIGERIGSSPRRSHTFRICRDIRYAEAGPDGLRIAEFDGVVPKPQPRMPARENRRPHEPAIVKNVDRFRQTVRFRTQLDDLTGPAARAFAFQSRPIVPAAVNILVGGPVLLHAAPRRLTVEPAYVAEDKNRPAADAVEREPGMPVVDAIV